MKYLISSLFVILCSWIVLPVNALNQSFCNYTIKAQIEGLSKGDTICFENVIFPRFDLEPAFNVIVEEDNKFSYEGSIDHSKYFLISYKPLSGEEVLLPKRGLTLYINGGEILIQGTAENIYFCQIEGGVYDNVYVQKINSLENKLGIESALYWRLAQEARLSGDTLKYNEFSNKYNTFNQNNRTDREKLSELKDEFMKEEPSSVLNIIDMLQQVNFSPLEELESYYTSINKEAQQSYFGLMLKREIDNIVKLAPGNDAPDFTLQTVDGQQASLNDYSGYYLLIYHFGLCPGSLMMDPEVTSFYTENNDRVKVIGITIEDLNLLKELYEKTDPSEKIMDIALKPALGSMTSHPWPDVESKNDNEQIALDYAFGGLPFFIFISPEGKILERGFSEAFYKAKELISLY
ncbi:MAG: peroxiredoxin family protein [Tannerella sp.]|jgi:hypothetical protein|nr:peroxiredoxin family protein [Tannerella sp.]